MSEDNPLWTKLTPQIEMIIPGAWAGMLAVGLAAWMVPDPTKKWIESVGSVLALPVVVFSGVVIYLIYRVVIGEWILYPLRHELMRFFDWARGAKNGRVRYWGIVSLLGSRITSESRGSIRHAYSAIRDAEDGPFSASQRSHFDFLHATYHLFYITGLELIALFLLQVGLAIDHTLFSLFLGFAMLIVAIAADWRHDMWEARLMQSRFDALDHVLEDLGYELATNRVLKIAAKRQTTSAKKVP